MQLSFHLAVVLLVLALACVDGAVIRGSANHSHSNDEDDLNTQLLQPDHAVYMEYGASSKVRLDSEGDAVHDLIALPHDIDWNLFNVTLAASDERRLKLGKKRGFSVSREEANNARFILYERRMVRKSTWLVLRNVIFHTLLLITTNLMSLF
jgi:hypothetical protein